MVSNANAYDTVHTMLPPGTAPTEYLARMEKFSVSLSSFQIFLGLKKNLVREIGIKDTEIFHESGYEADASYRASLHADVEHGGWCVMLYDNVYRGYSPQGKNTLSILALQGYDHWLPYEVDYFKNRKDAYRREKERLADILIDKVGQTLLPGLRRAIEVKEIGTPLTNVRYTGNYRGAVYGWIRRSTTPGRGACPTPRRSRISTSPVHGHDRAMATAVSSAAVCSALPKS